VDGDGKPSTWPSDQAMGVLGLTAMDSYRYEIKGPQPTRASPGNLFPQFKGFPSSSNTVISGFDGQDSKREFPVNTAPVRACTSATP